MNSYSPFGVFILLFTLFSVIGIFDARTMAQLKGGIFVAFVASIFTTLFMFFAEQLR